MRALKVDPEFQDKIPPLTEEEFRQLEANILEDGAVLHALIVWDGVILDGHNRYKIIQQHPELEYHVYEKAFPDRYAAVAWICKNQLGRRNLTPQQKKYLVGQQYEAEKMSHGGDRKSEGAKSSPENLDLMPKEKTSHRIARALKTSHDYVERAGKYAKGVDAAEEALPGMKQELLSGAIRPAETAVAAVAKAPPEERRLLAEALRDTKGEETRRSSPKSAMQQIRNISDQLLGTEQVAGEEDMLNELESAVSTMIQRCNACFQQYPDLLTARKYRTRVMRILEETKKYIQKIRGDAGI